MSKVRFMHISDVMLGADAEINESWKAERKGEIYRTFENIIGCVKKSSVDFLVISGNLFAHQPNEEDLAWLDKLLGELTDTIVIYIAGFYDNLGGECALMTYQFVSSVYVMGRPLIDERGMERNLAYRDKDATMALDCIHFPQKKVDVYGVSYFGKQMDLGAIDDIEPLDKSVHNILVACGGDKHRMPVRWSKVREDGFDYVALGGHQKYSVQIPGKAYYSGSPEAVSADSMGAHGYIYGELDNEKHNIKFVPAAVREYKRIDYQVDNYTKNGELGDVILKFLEKEGREHIYTINLIRAEGCEKNFDISDMLAGFRVLRIIGERFERSDYSEYVRANRNTEFGRMLEKMDDSELKRSSGAKLAVDMMIDMSGLYSKNSKKMGNDTFQDIKRQVRSLLETECRACESEKEFKEYMDIRNDYAVSPDVLGELNSVWANERALELEMTTVRNHMEELPKQYRRKWIRTGMRSAVVPMLVMGMLSILLLSTALKRTSNPFSYGRVIYILSFTLFLIGVVCCIVHMVVKYWQNIKRGGRLKLNEDLESDRCRLAELAEYCESVHKKRVELQKLDGRRRDIYEKMNDREKKLESKLRRIELMHMAIRVISECEK